MASICASCGLIGAKAWCTGCNAVAYCGESCADAHWGKHAFICGSGVKREREEEEKLTIVSNDGTEIQFGKDFLKDSFTLKDLFEKQKNSGSIFLQNADAKCLKMLAEMVEKSVIPIGTALEWNNFWVLLNFLKAQDLMSVACQNFLEEEDTMGCLSRGNKRSEIRKFWKLPEDNRLDEIYDENFRLVFRKALYPFEAISLEKKNDEELSLLELPQEIWDSYIFPFLENYYSLTECIPQLALSHPRMFEIAKQYVCPKLRIECERLKLERVADKILFSAYLNASLLSEGKLKRSFPGKKDAQQMFALKPRQFRGAEDMLSIALTAFSLHGGVAGIRLALQE